eukprot:g58002.t1
MSSRARTSVSVSDRSHHLKGEALAASNPLPHASPAIALHNPLKAASGGVAPVVTPASTPTDWFSLCGTSSTLFLFHFIHLSFTIHPAITLLFRQRQWDYKLSTQAMAIRE